MRAWFALLCLITLPLPAARRDFLTAAEVEQLREEQEPNKRLVIYIGFAKERIAYLQQLLAKEKTGRSAVIHEVLDEYAKIVDAIDTVSDDALARRVALDVGLQAVADGEKQMLAVLQAVADDPPKDSAQYKFVLEQAILATEDSLELAQRDLKSRTDDVVAREKKEREEREAALRPGEAEEKKAAQKKEEDRKKKAPTLRRPGESAAPPPK